MGNETEISRDSRDRNLELIRSYNEAPTVELANVYLNELIINNTNLIYQTIKKYYQTYYASSMFEDLVQAGRIGMFQAIKHFDPEKSEFATFFVYYIKGEINKAINKEQNKTTQHFSNVTRAIAQAKQTLAAKGFDNPTISQLAEETGKPAQAIHNALSVSNIAEAVHIDSSINAYSSPMNVERDVEDRMVNESLTSAIDRLPVEHRLIIYHAFGFINGKEYGDTAIAKILESKGFKTNPSDVKKKRISALQALGRDPEVHRYFNKSTAYRGSDMVECSTMTLMSEESFRSEYEKLEEVGALDADFDFNNEYVTSFEDSNSHTQDDVLNRAEA